MKILSSNLRETVNILSDLNYHDGDSIGNKLGITRSAVWKIIKKLQDYGIKINSTKSKGYALESTLRLLDENYIKKSLSEQDMEITVFESVESTNDYLKNLGKINPIPRICLAEYQTKGRGRHSRSWHAPFGQNLTFSYAYPIAKDVSELAGLSLVVGLSVINTLKEFNFPKKLSLKWPNDILYEDKKIVGILIDVVAESNGQTYIIIGIGINVNMSHDEENIITQKWDSLSNILGSYIDRNKLFTNLIKCLIAYLNKFEYQGFSAFADEFCLYDSLFDKQIKVLSGNSEVQGMAIGINNLGHLLVQLAGGEIKICSSGDTTIIK